MSFLKKIRDAIQYYRNMNTATPAAAMLGRAIRLRKQGQLKQSREEAIQALHFLHGPKVVQATPAAVALMVEITALLADVCESLGLPAPPGIIRRTLEIIEPLEMVSDAQKQRIASLVASGDSNK